MGLPPLMGGLPNNRGDPPFMGIPTSWRPHLWGTPLIGIPIYGVPLLTGGGDPYYLRAPIAPHLLGAGGSPTSWGGAPNSV